MSLRDSKSIPWFCHGAGHGKSIDRRLVAESFKRAGLTLGVSMLGVGSVIAAMNKRAMVEHEAVARLGWSHRLCRLLRQLEPCEATIAPEVLTDE